MIYENLEQNHEWETSHEPLDSGLRINSKMAKIEKRCNFKSPSKKWYENLKQNYWDLLLEKLLESNYKLGEVQDIFNYCFREFYRFDIQNNKPIIQSNGKKKQRTREEVINDFLKSRRFEEFNVTDSVSKINVVDSIEVLGFYGEMDDRTVRRVLERLNREYNRKHGY